MYAGAAGVSCMWGNELLGGALSSELWALLHLASSSVLIQLMKVFTGSTRLRTELGCLAHYYHSQVVIA